MYTVKVDGLGKISNLIDKIVKGLPRHQPWLVWANRFVWNTRRQCCLFACHSSYIMQPMPLCTSPFWQVSEKTDDQLCVSACVCVCVCMCVCVCEAQHSLLLPVFVRSSSEALAVCVCMTSQRLSAGCCSWLTVGRPAYRVGQGHSCHPPWSQSRRNARSASTASLLFLHIYALLQQSTGLTK